MVNENHGDIQLSFLNQNIKDLDTYLLEDEIIYGQVGNTKKV